MKILGAVLVISCSTVIGLAVAREYTLRIKQLEELQTAFKMLETEISYGVNPLPQAFSNLAYNLAAPIAKIFGVAKRNLNSGLTASRAWEEAVEEIFEDTSLKEKDKKVLIDFSHNLGQTASEDQLRYLNLIQNKLNNLYQEAKNEEKSKVKLWRYLGVLGGLFVVILVV